jgi:HEAT repeat protein
MNRRPCWLLVALPLASCGPAITPDFNSPEPAARNAAIVRAGTARDHAALPHLVRMLDSDDPATRLLAIQALERLTGQRLGYDPAEAPARRDAAVQRWCRYVGDHGSTRSPAGHD